MSVRAAEFDAVLATAPVEVAVMAIPLTAAVPIEVVKLKELARVRMVRLVTVVARASVSLTTSLFEKTARPAIDEAYPLDCRKCCVLAM